MSDDRERAIWIEEIERVANEQAGNTDQEDTASWIRLPDEMNDFLREVGGVDDMDLGYDGMAEFTPPALGPIEEDRLVERDTRRQWMRQILQKSKVDSTHLAGIQGDYEVLAGFLTGESGREDYYTWRSFYLYCRPLSERSDGRNMNFSWRIMFDEMDVILGQVPMFDSIVDFLDWYARWPERMDEAKMKDFMY